MFSIIPLSTENGGILEAIHAACFPDAWDRATFDQLLKEKTTCGWMAISPNDTPIGFILARGLGEEGEILTFAVTPSSQRIGVGKHLLKELVGFLTSVGVQKIFLEVAKDNIAAIDLYKSFKFTTVGTRRNYYQRSNDTFVDATVLAYVNK